jgi:hypothetical protein
MAEVGALLERLDVVHLAGTPFELPVPVLQGDGTATPTASVTDARAHVRASVDSDVILYVFSVDDDTIELVDDGGESVVRLHVDSAETDEWQLLWPGRDGRAVVWWDLEITTSDGAEQIIAPSTFTLYHQVTR